MLNEHDRNTIKKYSNLSSNQDDKFFVFMNDGYADVDNLGLPIDADNFILSNNLKQWKYQANLYHKCLQFAGISFDDQQGVLLDLSCGRGGGLKFIQDNYKFSKLIGLDLTPFNVNFSRNWLNNIDIIQGSATRTGIVSETIDVLLSVEAYSYYVPCEDYVKESYNILKPGGLLIQASAFSINELHFLSSGFKKIFFKDITYNVSLATALTKYILRQKDEEFFRIFYSEEDRFINKTSDYNITIFKKI